MTEAALSAPQPGPLRRMLAAHRGWPPLLRFVSVGLLNTAVGYLIFAVLLLAGCWPPAALAAAMMASLLFNFQTTRRMVFFSKGHGKRLRFAGMYIALLLVNMMLLNLLQKAGMAKLNGQAILSIPLAAISFVIQKFYVFGDIE
jgi:putative flippase GtrA